MSQASSSTCLQRPLFLIALFLIDLGQISLVAKAMRPYPAYPPPAAWTQQQQQYVHRHSQERSEASSEFQQHSDRTIGLASRNEQMLDPAPDKVLPNCGGGVALSPSQTDCARSPAPEEAEGSEIDPRYGVEKRLVPTGPNPLHN
eukprot:c17619_g1_i1 orf=504-938(-)